MKKIIINGKEYDNFDDLKSVLKQSLKDENGDGVPDTVEGLIKEAKRVVKEDISAGDPFGGFSGNRGQRDVYVVQDVQVQQQQKRNQVVGCVCIALLPFLIIGIVLYNMTDGNLLDIIYQGTVSPPGDVNKFDPVKSFASVKAYAGSDVQLASMEADQVRSDGTMSLKVDYLPAPSLKYEFYHALKEKPANAPPVGAGGSTDKWFERVTVNIGNPGKWSYMKRIGGKYSFEGNYLNQGMKKDISNPLGNLLETLVADPACSFAEFWKVALQNGAPTDAVANIVYDYTGYAFTIRGTKIDLLFDENCKLKKTD